MLAFLSGAQMGSILDIKKCQKIFWHCPFKHQKNLELFCLFIVMDFLIKNIVLDFFSELDTIEIVWQVGPIPIDDG